MSELYHQQGSTKTHQSLLIMVIVMCLVFFLQLVLGDRFEDPLMVVPKEIVTTFQSMTQGGFSLDGLGRLGTLLSYAFLHGDAEHLLFNMIYFWMFGALSLELLGKKWMFLLFFFTSLTGGICHVVMNPDEVIPMLGASGAVMGFEGAYLAMAFRWKLPEPHVWPISRPIPPTNLVIFALIGIIGDYMGIIGSPTGIAYGAHIGGFLGGVFLAGFLAPKPRQAMAR